MQNIVILLLFLLLMKPYTHTEDNSNNIIQISRYNPKYGLLYRSLCDASVLHTYNSLLYAGKPEDLSGDASRYYISGSDEYTKYLVHQISRHNSIQGCNISMDRYFTSVKLAEWALDRNFTVVGTMRRDRKGIPKELKVMKNRDERSILYVHHGEKISYLFFILIRKSHERKTSLA